MPDAKRPATAGEQRRVSCCDSQPAASAALRVANAAAILNRRGDMGKVRGITSTPSARGDFMKLLLSLASLAFVTRFNSGLGRSQSVEGANKLKILLSVVAQR